jgi:hypothetical protein
VATVAFEGAGVVLFESNPVSNEVCLNVSGEFAGRSVDFRLEVTSSGKKNVTVEEGQPPTPPCTPTFNLL